MFDAVSAESAMLEGVSFGPLHAWMHEQLTKVQLGTSSRRDFELLSMLFKRLARNADTCLYFKNFDVNAIPSYRKVSLSLLAEDCINKPETFEYGVMLLESLLSSELSRGFGLWVPQAVVHLKRAFERVRSASRLVLGSQNKATLVSCICQGLASIMEAVDCRYTVTLTASLIPFALSAYAEINDSSDSFLLAIVSCLRFIWESRCTKIKSSKLIANAALERAKVTSDWEIDGFNLAVKVSFLEQSFSSLEIEKGLCAIYFCFLSKSRQEAHDFVRSSSISARQDSLLRLVSDTSRKEDIRLYAAKCLDILFSVNSSALEGLTSEGSDEVETEMDDNEEELRELERDRLAFVNIVGPQLSDGILRRFENCNEVGGCLGSNADLIGASFEWLLCLQRIDAAAVHNSRYRFQCGNYLRKSGVVGLFMRSFLKALPDFSRLSDIAHLFQHLKSMKKSSSINPKASPLSLLVAYATFRTIYTLPAMVRGWWNDECTREQKSQLKSFIEGSVSSAIAGREVALIGVAATEGRWSADELTVKGSAISREVIAVYNKDGASIELKIKLPPAYPLVNVEVECSSRIGVSEARWKRWILQIIQLLSMQDGSVVDAVLVLKKNIDKEFEGVEACPICYCILHPKTMALPSLTCPTCANKFHSQCLFTWFKSSGKSKCVLCQQPFFL